MTYTIYELLCFFVIYSVLGWCLEVCFCTINTGRCAPFTASAW